MAIQQSSQPLKHRLVKKMFLLSSIDLVLDRQPLISKLPQLQNVHHGYPIGANPNDIFSICYFQYKLSVLNKGRKVLQVMHIRELFTHKKRIVAWPAILGSEPLKWLSATFLNSSIPTFNQSSALNWRFDMEWAFLCQNLFMLLTLATRYITVCILPLTFYFDNPPFLHFCSASWSWFDGLR